MNQDFLFIFKKVGHESVTYKPSFYSRRKKNANTQTECIGICKLFACITPYTNIDDVGRIMQIVTVW